MSSSDMGGDWRSDRVDQIFISIGIHSFCYAAILVCALIASTVAYINPPKSHASSDASIGRRSGSGTTYLQRVRDGLRKYSSNSILVHVVLPATFFVLFILASIFFIPILLSQLRYLIRYGSGYGGPLLVPPVWRPSWYSWKILNVSVWISDVVLLLMVCLTFRRREKVDQGICLGMTALCLIVVVLGIVGLAQNASFHPNPKATTRSSFKISMVFTALAFLLILYDTGYRWWHKRSEGKKGYSYLVASLIYLVGHIAQFCSITVVSGYQVWGDPIILLCAFLMSYVVTLHGVAHGDCEHEGSDEEASTTGRIHL